MSVQAVSPLGGWDKVWIIAAVSFKAAICVFVFHCHTPTLSAIKLANNRGVAPDRAAFRFELLRIKFELGAAEAAKGIRRRIPNKTVPFSDVPTQGEAPFLCRNAAWFKFPVLALLDLVGLDVLGRELFEELEVPALMVPGVTVPVAVMVAAVRRALRDGLARGAEAPGAGVAVGARVVAPRRGAASALSVEAAPGLVAAASAAAAPELAVLLRDVFWELIRLAQLVGGRGGQEESCDG